jgi:class 3 adenylate cyclase
MPRIPFFRIGQAEESAPVPLATYRPSLSLQGLQVGIDNLRHDVYLSPKFVDAARSQLARLIVLHGEVETPLAAEVPASWQRKQFAGPVQSQLKGNAKTEPGDLKPLLTQVQIAALNRAKAEGNICVDLLARLALVKFLRTELNTQFAQVLERCRIMLKGYEGVRQQKALEYREQVAAFQVRKKIILRKVGQELFRTLREIEKETLLRTRRSFFGDSASEGHDLFLNLLIFTEDGRDDYLSAEHYVMFGNFDKDPDRFANLRRIVMDFFSRCGSQNADEEGVLEGWLNAPENSQALVGAGSGLDDSTAQARAQKARQDAWVSTLESEGVMEYIIASYEVVPLLAVYAPRINAQQLKNALVSKVECERVEGLIAQHGKLSSHSLRAAVTRVASARGPERTKIASRFLRDFLRYHRDLRRLETLNSALDSVNLLGNEKLRELSSVNGTLYEFLLPEEQKPTEEKILDHVILKADIRDSSRLTRSLNERGLNPASYFSLNFYDPVNKLLDKYGASKVFLEGDAIILALLEKEGEPALAVSRACVLAREIVEIVRGYNELVGRSGLPGLELGVGISYQQSPPLYLMDGDRRIMISDALNESDRLSSCNKRARKAMEHLNSPFRVYTFQTMSDDDAGENTEDFRMSYNVGGIRISDAAFSKLSQEISLQTRHLPLPALWGTEKFSLYSGLVPLGNGIFRNIVIRKSQVAHIDPRTFSLSKWTDRSYYEVCTAAEIYAALEKDQAAAATR